MKSYTITVNGKTYDVTVEENNGAVSAPVVRTETVARPAAKAEAPKSTGAKGGIQVVAPMPGKILSVKANVGDAVKKGQVIMILEAMKMENEIVAPEDGTVKTIEVKDGASVDAGALLATLG